MTMSEREKKSFIGTQARGVSHGDDENDDDDSWEEVLKRK